MGSAKAASSRAGSFLAGLVNRLADKSPAVERGSGPGVGAAFAVFDAVRCDYGKTARCGANERLVRLIEIALVAVPAVIVKQQWRVRETRNGRRARRGTGCRQVFLW